MIPDQVTADVVARLGVHLQIAGSLLCFVMGLLLLRGIGRGSGFTWWAYSYAAMAVAVTAIAVRYYLLASVALISPDPQSPSPVPFLFGIYAGAKLCFLGCLVVGTWRFVTRKPVPRHWVRAGFALAFGVGVLLTLVPTDLERIMLGQSVFAIPLFLVCAWWLAGIPVDRRTRGSRLLGFGFVALAVLWALYVPGFLQLGESPQDLVGRWINWLTVHNAYVDTFFAFLLGFGMVLAVLDEVFREAEDARSARLKAVAASESRLSQIIRAASDGIVLLDGSRRILHCNPAALEILGSEEPALQGMSFDRFIVPDQVNELWTPSRRRIRHRGVTPPGGGHALRGRRADGTEFPMEISLRTVGGADSEGFVLIVRDRTEQVLEEAERAQTLAQLAQTARLESIGRMVSGVAHELNNPLTAILAFAQDLQSQARSESDVEALTTIVSQSQRCRAIVQDLLTSARGDREGRQPVAPTDLVASVRQALERQAAEREIDLEIVVPEGLPQVSITPASIEQVLTNLVVNAFQASGAGGKVRLLCRVEGDRLALVVEDDGPGLSDAVLPRLFEPFFTTKAPGEGTGLGLSVSHAIVDQHGGALRAENRTGHGVQGARFTVLLPFLSRRTTPRSEERLPRSDILPAALPAAEPGTSRRLLLIDDENTIRMAVRRYLERRGWTVEEAKDGREALELLGLEGGGLPAIERFDAIVSDLRMPGVSGMEIYDRLSREAPDALPKLVLISGDTASADVAEFVTRLRHPLLQKPFDMRALSDLLDRAAPPSRSTAVQPPG